MATDPRGHDRFHIRQLVRPMVNRYEVSTLGGDRKSEGDPVCFVEQRRFKLKEELTAFTDASRGEVVFRIKARKVWDPRGEYDVRDGEGSLLGALRKRFGRSLLRSTWEIDDPAGEPLGWAQERSAAVAIARRIKGFLGLIPLVGWVFDLLPVPYHFLFHRGESEVGELRRIIGIRDRYSLDLSGDAEREIDRRVALALAIGLDALQAR
jgi:uncharacterized protein YxjI